MYLSHWKLRSSPFAGRVEAERLFPSNTHNEALARLEFLFSNHRPVGLLLGASGTGKSLLLHKLASVLTRRGCRVAFASLIGTSPEELLWSVAAQLGCGDRAEIAWPKLWTRISDRIVENRRLQLATAMLFDDIDAASSDLQSLILRLVHADPSPGAQHTLVLSCDADRIVRVSARLLERIDLRVDLDPWDEADTAEYVRRALAEAGCSEAVFDEQALAQLHEFSGGVPRHVNRLADLALIAAASQRADQVNGETVAAVAGELVAC